MWPSESSLKGNIAGYTAVWVLAGIFLLSMSGCSVYRNYSDAWFWKHILQETDTSGVLGKGFTGLVVQDAISGKTIFSHNGDKNFTPASNVKILTLYSCIKTLGDSIPSFRYQVADSFLYLWPMADPTLMHPDFEKTKVLDNIKAIAGSRTIRVSLAHVSQPHYGRGWMWDDYLDDYQPEITALPMYGNVVQFRYSDNQWSAVPQEILDSSRVSAVHSGVWRSRHRNDFHLPANPDTSKVNVWEIPTSTSLHSNLKLFENILGIKVEQVAVPVAKGVSTIYSMPVDSVYRRLMQQSDNLIAEHLLLMCGMVAGDSLSTSFAIDTVKKAWLKGMPGNIKWVDGSGLSRYNQASPEQMTWLLGQLWRTVPRDELFSCMDSGKRRNGTLRHFFSSENEMELFAKTGSMQGVYNLSGYLKTKKRRLLIFSIMNNNFQGSVSGARRATDKILTKIGNRF
jgi:D-alanyl-D-alanine carboxypeptidase/D-alanyl-D-alanine-endopeptidase (penicillin-binding protein 4)